MEDVVEVLSLLGAEGSETVLQPLDGSVYNLAALLFCPRNQAPKGTAVHSRSDAIRRDSGLPLHLELLGEVLALLDPSAHIAAVLHFLDVELQTVKDILPDFLVAAVNIFPKAAGNAPHTGKLCFAGFILSHKHTDRLAMIPRLIEQPSPETPADHIRADPASL